MKGTGEKKAAARVLNIAALIVLVCMTGYVLLRWQKIPDRIPGHFNGAGNIDRMTGKGSLIFLVGIPWFFYLFLGLMGRLSLNTEGMGITKEGSEKIKNILQVFNGVLKLVLSLIFSYIIVSTMKVRPLGSASLFIVLAGIFLPILWMVVCSVRISRKYAKK